MTEGYAPESDIQPNRPAMEYPARVALDMW